MDEPVTVTVAHQVVRGREDDFCAWATEMLREAAQSNDYLGGGVLSPGSTGGDWHIVYRWSDESAARRWEVSAVRAHWMASASGFIRAAGTRRTRGVRAWFDLPSRVMSPPPKWKTALVTLAAVFPPVLLFNMTLIPYLRNVSVVLRTLALCIGVTVVVTWVMMPRLMRLFKGWLQPGAQQLGLHRPAQVLGRSSRGRRLVIDLPPPIGGPAAGRRAPHTGEERFQPVWLEVQPQRRGQPQRQEAKSEWAQRGHLYGQPLSIDRRREGHRRPYADRRRQLWYSEPQPLHTRDGRSGAGA